MALIIKSLAFSFVRYAFSFYIMIKLKRCVHTVAPKEGHLSPMRFSFQPNISTYSQQNHFAYGIAATHTKP
jgi:hypothetical protein